MRLNNNDDTTPGEQQLFLCDTGQAKARSKKKKFLQAIIPNTKTTLQINASTMANFDASTSGDLSPPILNHQLG